MDWGLRQIGETMAEPQYSAPWSDHSVVCFLILPVSQNGPIFP